MLYLITLLDLTFIEKNLKGILNSRKFLIVYLKVLKVFNGKQLTKEYQEIKLIVNTDERQS